jgi:putative transposase
MYRILAAVGEVRERRDQRCHPIYAKPELLATGPNELWSWDITKLRGPAKWTYYQLYVILDVYSRYVTGWMVATRESAALAERLIADSATKQGIVRDSLTIHCRPGHIDDLASCRAPAGRSRDRQEPLPAARE